MSPNAAKLAGQAAQRAFPFMKDAALKGSRDDQTWMQMAKMAEMVGAGVPQAKPQPWQRFTELIKGFRGGENVEVNPMRPLGRMNDPTAPYQSVKFSLEPRGGGSQWHGGFKPDSKNPFQMYVEHLTSDASRRKSIGGEAGALQTYKADISSPAQKDWGWGKPKPSRQPGREARSPEDRVSMDEFRNMRRMGYHQPGPSAQEKQQLVDRLMDMARRSGFKEMAFSAEPGERPRLYSKLMGYDFKPTGEGPLDPMSRMMSSFPGRQGVQQLSPDRVVAPQVRSLLRHDGLMDEHMAENVLGLSVDEGIDFGFIQQHGNGFKLTEQGRQAAQSWLQGMGQ